MASTVNGSDGAATNKRPPSAGPTNMLGTTRPACSHAFAGSS